MDLAHAKKAAEAGVVETPTPDVPPPPYPATPTDQKPPLPKKCFMTLVLCILIGICVSIAYVVNMKKAEAAQAEWLKTSTTVTTTTTPALRDLSDEQILEKCGGKYTAKLGKSDIAIFSGWNGHGAWHFDICGEIFTLSRLLNVTLKSALNMITNGFDYSSGRLSDMKTKYFLEVDLFGNHKSSILNY